jgi:hypothetical protein
VLLWRALTSPKSTACLVAGGVALMMAAGCEQPPDSLAPTVAPEDSSVGEPPWGPDAGPAPDGASDQIPPLPDDYSVVVLPDTQYYASSWPDIFMSQARWIVENHADQRIAFVLHTGDLVDEDLPVQWDIASRALHLLDGVVPYVVAAGNHDYRDLADRVGMVNLYFPPAGFATNPWFGGTFEVGHIENSFSLINAGGARWLVISLEFGPRDEALTWADSVLKVFSDRPAIIITHAFLYHDNTRYDQHALPSQPYAPHTYLMMGQGRTTINDGQEMWQKLIVPNPNVKMIFSGHDVSGDDTPPGTAGRLTSTRPDGSRVHQILANYQTCTVKPCTTSLQGTLVHGGNGYLRLLRFSPAAGTISVTTYSPYIDKWLVGPTNQFVLEMN